MAKTMGYAGRIKTNARDINRIWISLTDEPDSDKWVKIGQQRAWFFIQMSGSFNQPIRMAQYTMLLEALRNALHVRIHHGGASSTIHFNKPGDAFEIDDVEILRDDLHFS